MSGRLLGYTVHFIRFGHVRAVNGGLTVFEEEATAEHNRFVRACVCVRARKCVSVCDERLSSPSSMKVLNISSHE